MNRSLEIGPLERRPFPRVSRSLRPNRGLRLSVERLERRELLSAQGLDASFADAGKTLTAFSAPENYASAVAVQPDGKLVVVGTTQHTTTNFPRPTFEGGYALARYNADGSLDTTFGNGGKVETPLVSQQRGGAGVAIENDGTILVVGPGGLHAYNPDGSVDTNFGTNGLVSTAGTVWVAADGNKIITSGPDLRRYNADGSPDTSFGDQGVVSSKQFVTNFWRFAIDAQHRIVVATDSNTIYRFNSDGAIDATFGAGGIVSVPGASGGVGSTRVAITPDGKIVWSGNVLGGLPGATIRQIEVTRFNANGSIDAGFGTAGVTTISVDNVTNAYGLVVEPSGKIVLAGRSGTEFVGITEVIFHGNVFTARLNADGTLDPTWGQGGEAKIVADNSDSQAYAIAEQADGKIVVAGTNGGSFVVARYSGDFNQSLVEHAYLNLLGRNADPAGLSAFTGLLDQGGSREEVAETIEASPEYRQHVVSLVYQDYLQRAPDAGGLADWSAFLASGGTQEDLSAAILGSAEFYQLSGASTAAFLNQLYLDVLQRPIDSGGEQTFSEALAAGMSRGQVADLVLRSAENNSLVVTSQYQQLLGRSADSAGLTFFSNALAAGATWEQVNIALVASEEYFSGM